jgi:Ser/Thr protein kinase RdoA (MazF antagonist)
MTTPTSWVATRPPLDEADATALLRAHWGIVARLAPLPSERDRNLLIEPVEGGPRLVLKVANLAEDRSLLDGQLAAMDRLADAGVPVARIVPARDGSAIVGLGPEGGPPWARVVTWLPGRPLATVDAPGDDLLRDLGTVMGRSATALLDLPAGVADRPFLWDVRQATAIVAASLPEVTDADRRGALQRLHGRLVADLDPRLPALRHSVIHNDANDHNVLVDDAGTAVVGLLDFGDMVASVTAQEAAVPIVYAMFHRPDPTSVVGPILGGFDAACPLEAAEIEAMPALILGRLGLSLANAAHQATLDPDPYLRISEASAWDLLERLASLPASALADAVHEAVGR